MTGPSGIGLDANDQYRVRLLDTTFSVPRFNNANGQVTVLLVHSDGVPIGVLLAELAQRHRLDDVPVQAALRRILEASGLDFAISGRR